MEKWKKIIEAYAFKIPGNSLLSAFHGEHPEEGLEFYGLEIEDSEGYRFSAMFIPQTDQLKELRNPKELLNYRGIIIEAEACQKKPKKD